MDLGSTFHPINVPEKLMTHVLPLLPAGALEERRRLPVLHGFLSSSERLASAFRLRFIHHFRVNSPFRLRLLFCDVIDEIIAANEPESAMRRVRWRWYSGVCFWRSSLRSAS